MHSNNLSAVSPSSDHYDSFNSTSSRSIKQEPSTPPTYTPEDVINNLMFVDDSTTQMKTEYNAGKIVHIYYIYLFLTKLYLFI